MNDEVLFEHTDGIARITIHREARRNALSPAVIEALLDALNQFQAEPAVRVVCITGAGERAFCSGADLMASLSDGGSPDQVSRRYAELLQQMLAFSKPIVARVNGHALGGGLGIALAADIAIAAEHAKFGTPEVKVGLFPMMIAPLILQNMPKKAAMQMILCGDRITAQEALSFGMINQVVSGEQLDETVEARLRQLCAAAPLAQQRGKQALREVQYLDFDQAVERLSEHLTFLMQTSDAAEGISAFFEKRAANWSGE